MKHMSEVCVSEVFHYRIFGFNVESDIRLPGISVTGDGSCDLRIILGDVPVRMDDSLKTNYMYTNDKFCFHIKNLAHFYIENGNTMIIEKIGYPDMDLIREYVLSVAFSVTILQRQMIPMHGSAVVMDGKCLIFTGNSGAGKSSICNALVKAGYKFLSDDISVIVMDEDVPVVQAAYPQQKLCKDMVSNLYPEEALLQEAHTINDKFHMDNRESFSDKSARLSAIFKLVPKEACTTNLKELSGAEKLKSFLENIFFYNFIQESGMNPKIFTDSLRIVNKIPLFEIERPIGEYTVDLQIDLIRKLLGERGKDENQSG